MNSLENLSPDLPPLHYHSTTMITSSLKMNQSSQTSISENQPLIAAIGGSSHDQSRLQPAGETRQPVTSAATPSMLIRLAIRVSRSRWFVFLRRVFHYQNGSRSSLGSNPFDSSSWMLLEFMALVTQIVMTSIGLSVSKTEKPIWPIRIWVLGYDFGCVISLVMLGWRYKYNIRLGDGYGNTSDLEMQQRNNDVLRPGNRLVTKCRTTLELFYAMWFVMGNVWVFDTRYQSFQHAPKLHVLCIILLAWNAICYSFPFLLFIFLCICIPMVSSIIGYNISLGSTEKGASDDQISELPCWKYKRGGGGEKKMGDAVEAGKSAARTNDEESPECCICLTKYKDKEEIRQFPCTHMFHKKCVDQWLRIISCCPLCKQGL